MNDLSFDIRSSKDFFKKLEDDYLEFIANKTSSRVALNCALTAWHLTEWIYNEFSSQLLWSFPTISSFQVHIKDQCPSLQIMQDIANGTKHYLLTKYKPKVKGTTLHKGSFSKDFSRAFDISTLDIQLNNGSKIYFEDEIQTSIQFWKSYLTATFNLTL